MRNFRTVLVLCLATLSCVLRAQDKLRIIIETDAGGDADDEQSLVRFLAYANEWDVEGIIANRPVARPVENLNPERTGLGIAQRLVRAYGEVYPNLKENAEGYPTEAYLMDRTVAGYNSTEAGVNLIIAAVDRDDPRPIWFLNWGTDWGSAQSCLQRALDKVLGERGYEGYSKFKNKIRLSSSDRFNDHTTKLQPFWRMWVEKQFPMVDGEMWYHRFAPLTAKAGGFNLQRDVLTGHGALGALYPTNTTVPQKEGDSILFVYLIPTGMNDPMHPDWGSWGGRYGVRDDFFRHVPTYYGPNVRDTWNGTTNRDNTLARWAADLQNDFRARMDWCVKPFSEANHSPVAVLNSDRTRKILEMEVRAGASVDLSAEGSSDPDGDKLYFEWIPYPEAGGFPGEFNLGQADSINCHVRIPVEAAGYDLHVILAVRDHGKPPLVNYRRAILHVRPAS
jgi:hypothetical protein